MGAECRGIQGRGIEPTREELAHNQANDAVIRNSWKEDEYGKGWKNTDRASVLFGACSQ